MRIAVISTFFDESLEYQEVHYARVLCRLGHEVKVFSTYREASIDSKKEELAASVECDVIRLGPCLSLGHTVVPFCGIRQSLKDFGPQCAFVLGPNHCFPWRVAMALPPGCKVVCYFGDHDLNIRSGLSRRLFKDRWYRSMFNRADSIIPATPITQSILQRINKGISLADKVHYTGLMIDPEWSRQATGTLEMDLAKGHNLISNVTVVRGAKPFEKLLTQIDWFLEKHESWSFALMGLSGNSRSDQVRRFVEKLNNSNRIHLLSIGNSGKVRKLFERSSLLLSFAESIAIQQAKMCLRPVVVPRLPTMEYLVNEGKCGAVYGNVDLEEKSVSLYEQCLSSLASELEIIVKKKFSKEALESSAAQVDAEKALSRILNRIF